MVFYLWAKFTEIPLFESKLIQVVQWVACYFHNNNDKKKYQKKKREESKGTFVILTRVINQIWNVVLQFLQLKSNQFVLTVTCDSESIINANRNLM